MCCHPAKACTNGSSRAAAADDQVDDLFAQQGLILAPSLIEKEHKYKDGEDGEEKFVGWLIYEDGGHRHGPMVIVALVMSTRGQG